MANRYEDKVASVSKALTIMELLSKDPQGMGLVEISNLAGMNKTTVYRLLTSLMEKEYVEQDEKSGKYSLGLKILSVASALYEKMDIRAVVRKHAQELLNGFPGTLLVTKEINGEFFLADVLPLDERNVLSLRVGGVLKEGTLIQRTFQVNKALWQPGRSILSVPEDPEVRRENKQILIQGYAESQADIGEVAAVAAPVFDFSRNVAYVVSMHASVLREKRVQSEWILTLLKFANALSNDLGYAGYV